MKDFEVFHNIEELDNESKYLVHKAKEATTHAYAPYSKFHVGAAVILDDGTVVTGANQENASYPLCMCAERVALYTAASLHPGKKITKLAVVAHKRNHKELMPATSCGASFTTIIGISTEVPCASVSLSTTQKRYCGRNANCIA